MITGLLHLHRYKYLFGDKDVFRFAALHLLKPYYEIKRLPTFVGYRDEKAGRDCGIVFAHKWIDGEYLFFHANNVKYRTHLTMSMFNQMQTHGDDTDYNIEAYAGPSSENKPCVSYKAIEGPNELIVSQVSSPISGFLEIWFDKIQACMRLMKMNEIEYKLGNDSFAFTVPDHSSVSNKEMSL